MEDLRINPDVEIQQATLYIRGNSIDKYEIISKLGQGNNGIVFLAKHKLLHTFSALKVWLKLNPIDTRDKVVQALEEVRKMARAHPNHVAQLYDGDIVDNAIFYANMEYVQGNTLKSLLHTVPDTGQRKIYAYLYLQAIEQTTTPEIAHGDAHHGNVMIFREEMANGQSGLRLKLIDFGTSVFMGKRSWEERHWKTVDKTFRKILTPFKGFKELMSQRRPDRGKTIRDRMARYDEVLGQIVRTDSEEKFGDILTSPLFELHSTAKNGSK